MSKFLRAFFLFLLFPSAAFAAPERILFVAPHPDDEMLGTGGQIWQAQQNADQGVDYRVVLLTCGDAYRLALNTWVQSGQARDLNGDGKIDYLDLGITRHEETLTALGSLGVPSEKVIFLGYPDQGLKKMMSSGARPYMSPQTEASSVPYTFAYHFGAPFVGESPIQDLKEIISSFNPTIVYSTTPTDEHPDHAQTREYVTAALQQAGGDRLHLEYLIHWAYHESGWPHPTTTWSVPKGHVPADFSVSLSDVGMTRQEKADAIRLYSTQLAVDGEFLLNYAKDAENFWYTRESLSDYRAR